MTEEFKTYNQCCGEMLEAHIPWIAKIVVEMIKDYPHNDVIDEDFVKAILEKRLGYAGPQPFDLDDI